MNSQKYSSGHMKITSWVAIIIIASIAATLGFFIWSNAHESWLYEDTYTKYPKIRKNFSTIVTSIETVTWRTYRDEGYGFQIQHPVKYQAGIGKVVNSLFSTANNSIPGASVGSLIFVKAEGAGFRTTAASMFDSYWNNTDCMKKAINNGLDIKVSFCSVFGSGRIATYALIKGKDFDIFVDGYTLSATNTMSQAEILTMLSSFKFTK